MSEKINLWDSGGVHQHSPSPDIRRTPISSTAPPLSKKGFISRTGFSSYKRISTNITHMALEPNTLDSTPQRTSASNTVGIATKTDVELETKCLYHWLRLLEKHFHARVPFDVLKTPAAVEEELRNHSSVQATIEKLVYRLSKLKNLCAEAESGEKKECQVEQIESRPKLHDRHLNLEKRLHQCWLKSLERQFVLEELLQKSSDKDTFDQDKSEINLMYYEPVQKCRRLHLHDTVHSENDDEDFLLYNRTDASLITESSSIMSGTSGTASTFSSQGTIQRVNGKLELVSQDIGYASESSTFNLSADDVSPSLPVGPLIGSTGSIPNTITQSTAHSDTDCDVKKPRSLEINSINAKDIGCLSASPNEFYYKVAPLALDIRAETLTRSVRGSLSKLRPGSTVAFSDDEEESRAFRIAKESNETRAYISTFSQSSSTTSTMVASSSHSQQSYLKSSSTSDGKFLTPQNVKRRENFRRATTLPPEQQTSLLAAQCTALPLPKTTRSRRHRPWSLILQESNSPSEKISTPPVISAAFSESALATSTPCSISFQSKTSRRRTSASKSTPSRIQHARYVVADWSVSSSDDDEQEGSVSDSGESASRLPGSRRTLTMKQMKKGRKVLQMKSQSTSTLWKRREADMDSSYWDDYQDPPYSSEAYSEKSVDESIIQKITNFGDDFSAIFPCGSSSYTLNGLNPSSSCSVPLDPDENVGVFSSDSDVDSTGTKELRSVLAGSSKQLRIAQAAKSRPEYLEEVRATCETNLRWLSTISSHFVSLGTSDVTMSSVSHFDDSENVPLKENETKIEEISMIEDLIHRWECLYKETMELKTCGNVIQNLKNHLREVRAHLQSYSLCFNDSPILIHSVEACQKLKTSLETKTTNLQKLDQETKRIIEDLFSHWSSCDQCTGENQAILDDANKCQRELEDTLNRARITGTDTEEYYLLLKSLRSKLTFLKASINHSLPDLVPDQTFGLKTDSPSPQSAEKKIENLEKIGCAMPTKKMMSNWKRKEVLWGLDVQSEWLSAQSVYTRLKNMERFILMDFELIQIYQDIHHLCEELSLKNSHVNLDVLEAEFRAATEDSFAKSVSFTRSPGGEKPFRLIFDHSTQKSSTKIQTNFESEIQNDKLDDRNFLLDPYENIIENNKENSSSLICTECINLKHSFIKKKDKTVETSSNTRKSFSSRARRTCLFVAPLIGLLIFLCLLFGIFLQPKCCSFITQRSLLTVSLDYPTGRPPV